MAESFDRVTVHRESRRTGRQGVGAKVIFGAELDGRQAEQHVNERTLRDPKLRARIFDGLDAELWNMLNPERH